MLNSKELKQSGINRPRPKIMGEASEEEKESAISLEGHEDSENPELAHVGSPDPDMGRA